VVALIGVAGWIVTQKEARRVEDERLRVEAEEAAAEKEKQDRLAARIEAFRDAWSRSDIAAIGALYPRSEKRRAERLPERFATRGWGETLPVLGPPHPEDRDQPYEAGTRLSHPAGDVHLVWQYSQPEWTLRFLKLPSAEAVQAYENRGKRPVAPASSPDSDGPRSKETLPVAKSVDPADGVVLRVIVESPEAFSPFPTFQILRDYFGGAFGVVPESGDAETAELIDVLLATIQWPIELQVSVVRENVSLCLTTANDAPFWMEVVRPRLGVGDPPDEPDTRMVGDQEFLFTDFSFVGLYIYEGVVHGRNRLVVTGEALEKQARERMLSAVSPPEPQAFEREMWERSKGGVLRALLSIKPLLSLVPEDERPSAQALLGTVCGEFSTVAVRADESDRRYELSIWADLAETSGILGTLLVPLRDEQGLVGWIPEETEFQSVSLNLETASQIAGLLDLAPDLSDLTEEFAEFEGIDLGEVLGSLDGRLLAVTTPCSPEEALDLEREPPVVLAFGVNEARGVLDDWRRALDPDAEVLDWEAAEEIGRGVRRFDEDGAFYCAERDHVVFIAISEASEALMNRVLDTNGVAPLPAVFTDRIDDLPPDSALISVTSTLSAVAEKFAEKSRGPQGVDPVLRQVFLTHLQEIERQGRGTSSGWIAVDEEGLKGRFVY